LLAEWHITPDYIVSNWTEELLELMVKKLVERKQRESDAISGKTSAPVESLETTSRGMVKVVKGKK